MPDSVLPLNLPVGYIEDVNELVGATEAARLLARRSVEVRRKKWGEEGFKRRLREWGKLGGRPKGSGKKKQRREAES